MQNLEFNRNGKKIIFDDFVDERGQDYGGIWVAMCKACARRYYDMLVDGCCDRLDECGSGSCSVAGCDHEADYYVDFWFDDDVRIVSAQ